MVGLLNELSRFFLHRNTTNAKFKCRLIFFTGSLNMILLRLFYQLSGCPMTKVGPLSTEQFHSPNINHFHHYDLGARDYSPITRFGSLNPAKHTGI